MLTIVFVMIVGCGKDTNNKKEETSNVALSDMVMDFKKQLASDFKAEGTEEEMLVDGELQGYVTVDLTKKDDNNPQSAIFSEKLNINMDDLEEGYILAPMMNVKSDEIIVLKAKDEKQVEALKKVLEKEKQSQIDTWEKYLPDQYEKVKKNVIKTKGKYLLYVTYDQPEKIVDIFNNSLK